MVTLAVLRHAKSDWSLEVSDRDRPLNKRGRRQAPLAGRWLVEHGPRIELAVVSPARRARETWERVAAELPGPPTEQVREEVYAADADDLLDVVRGLSGVTTAILVGHNPAVEDLVHRLTGEPVEMTTATLAVLELTEWTSPRARLIAAGRPPATPASSP